MTATRRCGTLQLGWPISTHARGHAPARHAAWIAVPWFALAPACASLHQHMQVGPERPLSQLTPTLNTPATKHRSTHLCTRTQNIATHSTQHKHPHTHTHIRALSQPDTARQRPDAPPVWSSVRLPAPRIADPPPNALEPASDQASCCSTLRESPAHHSNYPLLCLLPSPSGRIRRLSCCL
jgi:hypothetical protein